MAVRVRPNQIIPQTDEAAYFELDADSTEDLSGLETVGSFSIAPGSLCHVIATGEIYALDSDGNWKNQTSPETEGT